MASFADGVIEVAILDFCKKLLPHREFEFVGVLHDKYVARSLIQIDDEIYEGSLKIEFEKDYKNYKLLEFNKVFNTQGHWTTYLVHTNLKMVNVHKAYESMSSILRPFYIDVLGDSSL